MIKNTLNHVYNYAEKNELIDKNIIPLVEVEKRITTKQKMPFTSDQIKMLMKYNGHFYADTVKILLYTGMRISELFDIETKNVNLEKHYIIGGKKTEAGRDRIIPIHDEIFEIVKKRYNPDNKYLILSPKGRKVDYPNYVNLFWKNLKIKFDITQTPHDTRHTFITYATKQGLERAAIQKIVGHKVVDITDHYTHRSAEELLKEINKLKY